MERPALNAAPPDLRPLVARVPELRDVPFGAWTVTPLAGLTNRSFRLQADGHDYVLRVPGPETDRFISRADELHNTGAAAAAGVAPPYLYGDAASGLLVTRFIDGAAPLTAGDLGRSQTLTEAARLLRRLHESGAQFRGLLEPLAVVDRYLAIAGNDRIERLRRRAAASWNAQRPLASSCRPCHVDPTAGNFLRMTAGGLTLIDWEYSAMADPVWDLAVVALEGRLDRAGEEALLRAYDGTVDERRAGQLARHKPLVQLVGAAWTNAVRAPKLEPILDELETAWPPDAL